MYKHIRDVTVESLKKNHTMIHYFGLGFIQIKLGDKYRIHFYTSKLPAIIGDEDIHNHRYDFTSHILYGSFVQEIFNIVPGATYLLGEESCKKDSKSNTKETPCGTEKMMEQHYSRGSFYTISHKTFHRVKADRAITFLERQPVAKEFAEVAREANAPKVCPFSKKVSENELWGIVEEMLEEAYSH